MVRITALLPTLANSYSSLTIERALSLSRPDVGSSRNKTPALSISVDQFHHRSRFLIFLLGVILGRRLGGERGQQTRLLDDFNTHRDATFFSSTEDLMRRFSDS